MARKGFTLIELIVIMVIIGIIGAIGIPRYTSTQNRIRINAAEVEITGMRKALSLYLIDHNTYVLGEEPYAENYAGFKIAIRDPAGNQYMRLPDEGPTFTWVAYNAATDSFQIHVKAHDTDSTDVYGNQNKTYH